MKQKIRKINTEYEKNAAKIAELQAREAELQARQAELEKQRADLENLDIIGLVRGVGLTPDQLAAILHAADTTRSPEPEQEDSGHEEM